MSILSDNAKFQLKKIALLCSFFLALFFLGFYLVNIFDPKPVIEIIVPIQEEEQDFAATDELKLQADKEGINIADFQDWAKANGLKGKDAYNGDTDGDGLPNNREYLHGTDPNNGDTDGDKFSDKQEITNGYDPAAPGDAKPAVYVKVDKIGVDVPMIWTQSEDEKTSLKDLENGLSHFPKSAAPGENGNAIISGHSSNYVWVKGDFNYVFRKLNNVEKGDIVRIKTVQKNGKVFMFQYRITDKFVTTPDDERIFADTTNPTLTLSTCWPLGTKFKRLIVKGEIMR